MAKCTLGYSFVKRTLNENYSQAIVQPLRSCLLHHNSEIYPDVKIATKPKYITLLDRLEVDTDTGEISKIKYLTDDFKSKKGRIFKKIDTFGCMWQPEYTKKKVSILMHTFTMANASNMKFSDMIDNVKYRYKSIGFKLKAYFWVSEVSDDYHWHYHLIVVIDRMKLHGKKIPDTIKFNDLWGCRTQVAFVKKSINSYLSFYLNKSQSKVIGLRGCGSSRMPKKETLKININAIAQKKTNAETKVSKLLHQVYA